MPDADDAPDYRPLWHTDCGEVALEYDRPANGERLRSSRARHLDGSPATPLERLVCGSCNNLVREGTLRMYRPLPVGHL